MSLQLFQDYYDLNKDGIKGLDNDSYWLIILIYFDNSFLEFYWFLLGSGKNVLTYN